MTVTTTTSEVRYNCNGVTVNFPFSFLIPTEEALTVYLQTAADAPYVDITFQCGVTGIGDPEGGYITYPLVGSPAAAPQVISIVREVPNVQEITVTNQTRYDADVAMRVWDGLTMQIQQLKNAINRMPRFPIGSSLTDVFIQELLDGQVPMWDEAGTRFVSGPDASDISSAQSYAAAAEAARDEAEALVAAMATVIDTFYVSRAQAQAAVVDPAVQQIVVLHDKEILTYIRDPAGTALTTSGGVNWSPGTIACSPAHWGAVSHSNADQAAAIQACFNYVKGTRDSTYNQFICHLDGRNKTYVVKTSLNFGGVRQPDLLVRNLSVYGEMSGKIVIDATHSNQMIWENISVEGSESLTPSCGIHLGRDNSGAISPNHKMHLVRTRGMFSVAAVFNNASESWTCLGCFFENKTNGLAAYAVVICGNNTILTSTWPSYTSDYYTWFAGSQSCISHNLGFCQLARPSRSTLTITAITKAANAVITVGAAELAASHFQIGSVVYFHDIAGMTELNFQTATITAMTATTITININTTTYGTFTSGRVWTRTGPGLFLAACSNVVMHGNYILTYGNRSVEIDLTQGNVRGIDLTFQQEASPVRVVQFYVNAAHVVTDFRIKLRNISQTILTSIFNTSGSGTVEFRWLELLCSSDGDGLSFSAGGTVFSPRNDFIVKNGTLVVPDRAAADADASYTLPDNFQGTVFAYDDGQREIIHGGLQFPPGNTFADTNIMEDFEEGSWTPWLRFGGLSNGMVYAGGGREGRYIRIGEWVTVSWLITLTAKGTSTGAATIENLPFNILQAQAGGGAVTNYQNLAGITGAILVQPISTSESIQIRQGGAASAANLTDANFTNTTTFVGSVTYRVG